MQSYRKCCASAEISDILLAGFVFIKSLPTPLRRCYTNDILGSCMDYNERSTSMKHQLLNNVFSALLLSWTGGYVVTAPKKLTFIFTWLRFYLTLYCKIRWLYLCWKLQCEFQRQGPDCATAQAGPGIWYSPTDCWLLRLVWTHGLVYWSRSKLFASVLQKAEFLQPVTTLIIKNFTQLK